MGCDVAVDDHEVGGPSRGYRSEVGVGAEDVGAVGGEDLDGFRRGEAGFEEELVVPLVAEAGEDAADAGRVNAGREHANSNSELAGKTMEFNTETRAGRVGGKVRMLIYNLENETNSNAGKNAPAK